MDCQTRGMNAKICLVVLLIVTPLLGTSATENSDYDKRFSGKWEAKWKDVVICTIELRSNDTISGAMEDCRIHTDADGNLTEPEPSDASSTPSPILNPHPLGSSLNFEVKDEGESEPIRFEFTLIKEGVADLTIKNAPVKVKPIRFLRIPAAR
jgi:hypothetical protein